MKWTFKRGIKNPADPLSTGPSFKACATLAGKSGTLAMLNAITRGERKRTDIIVLEPRQDINVNVDDELAKVLERSP